jgi:hypothetical protein
VQDLGVGGDSVRDRLERVLSSYEEMDRRFTAAGGLGSLLNLYEQVRRELERVSFEELDRMTQEIKAVIEALLKMDYELRKVHNLKLVFETRAGGAGGNGRLVQAPLVPGCHGARHVAPVRERCLQICGSRAYYHAG